MNSDQAKLLRTYNIDYWGGNYFAINDKESIEVCPDPSQPQSRVDLAQLVQQLRQQNGLRLPSLFCFPP